MRGSSAPGFKHVTDVPDGYEVSIFQLDDCCICIVACKSDAPPLAYDVSLGQWVTFGFADLDVPDGTTCH
jgi:hypothetical protein